MQWSRDVGGIISVEVNPWSKTGGLGDVLGGLPPATAVNGKLIYILYFFFFGLKVL